MINLSVSDAFLIYLANAFNFFSSFFYFNKAFYPLVNANFGFGPNFFAFLLMFLAFFATF
jgi:hypothetical protein